MKKRSVTKKIVFLFCIAVCSIVPFAYVIHKGEYDKEQVYAPQLFAVHDYKVVRMNENKVTQSFVSSGDMLVGVDLIVYQFEKFDKSIDKINLLYEKGEIIRDAYVEQNLLVNSSDLLNIRFDPVGDSKGKSFSLSFEFTSDFQTICSQSDYYAEGELKIGDDLEVGDLNFVPVYKGENSLEFFRILLGRIFSSRIE